MLQGAVGVYMLHPQLLDDLDLLRSLEEEASSDPNVLRGTPCCPGSVYGVVRVVTSIEQTSVSGAAHTWHTHIVLLVTSGCFMNIQLLIVVIEMGRNSYLWTLVDSRKQQQNVNTLVKLD